MGRKTQISKEEMLFAGLEMIIEGKYSLLTIKSLAERINCSTQPIAWSFGNIESYRKELRQYAISYMQNKMVGDNIDNYGKTGYIYVDMAIDEPELLRYLRTDEEALKKRGGIGFIFDKERNAERAKVWENAFEISNENAKKYMEFIVIYTEGVVSMLLSGVIPPDREKAYGMITDAAMAYVTYLKTEGK